ncbi:hypothetical protein BKA69DRAFT_1039011 [Paraphysoderma sedebokerense]|nr:hypothetical protein BKA69DRAFT_1039011 [Paraphysoderma sedebokerense]
MPDANAKPFSVSAVFTPYVIFASVFLVTLLCLIYLTLKKCRSNSRRRQQRLHQQTTAPCADLSDAECTQIVIDSISKSRLDGVAKAQVKVKNGKRVNGKGRRGGTKSRDHTRTSTRTVRITENTEYRKSVDTLPRYETVVGIQLDQETQTPESTPSEVQVTIVQMGEQDLGEINRIVGGV